MNKVIEYIKHNAQKCSKPSIDTRLFDDIKFFWGVNSDDIERTRCRTVNIKTHTTASLQIIGWQNSKDLNFYNVWTNTLIGNILK